MYKISRAKYADMYGPTTGDRIRLADTALVIQVERDAARYGEEAKFGDAVRTCGKEYLGYVHVNESNRGVPGTGHVPFEEFFQAVHDIGYDGPMVIESFDPNFEELAGNCAIWRKLAPTGEDLARDGLANLKAIAAKM